MFKVQRILATAQGLNSLVDQRTARAPISPGGEGIGARVMGDKLRRREPHSCGSDPHAVLYRRLRFLSPLIGAASLLTLTMGATCNQPVIVVPSSFADTADQPPTVVGNRPLPPTVIIDDPSFQVVIDSFELLFLNHGAIIPGGLFPGGDHQSWNGQVRIHLVGTGTLAGWQRDMIMPLNGRIDSNVRPYGANVQLFAVELHSLDAQIAGDPDFDLLHVTAGTAFSLPSPGHTTLTRLQGGDWNVDSVFDVMYRVEYFGAPGGALAGHSGNEVRFQHIQIGQPPVSGGPPLELVFSPPATNEPAQVMIEFTHSDGNARTVQVPVNPGDSADQKRDQAVNGLNLAGAAAAASGPERCTVSDIAAGSVVRMTDLGSSEPADQIIRRDSTSARAAFPGVFDPIDPIGQPAIFTAGIVTDVGELSVQVSAQELNFQTDGPIICQALFQRLAPRAPQYGAQINYAGDRLEVYFDPAYTVTQGGIIFGTTSPTPGNYGQLESLPSGGPWNEQGDAPELMPGQSSSGTGLLQSINGSISGPDDVDLYCIRIDDPGQFQASTVGGATFDTQLFLFDAGGMGVTHNDDAPAGGSQSRITGQSVPGAGIYYLAIGAYNRDPLNPAALPIWNNLPHNVERTPDGPGAPGPLTQWQGPTAVIAPYTIQLAGCGFCDAGAPPIPPGDDWWATDEAPVVQFGGPDYPPIPADFFEPGSEPFEGVVQFGGGAIDPGVGDADTIVRRLAPLELFDVGSTDVILIEMVSLSLKSVAPITAAGRAWNVELTVPPPDPDGTMIVRKTHPTGGTFDATIYVQPVFVFTRVDGIGPPRYFDPGVVIEFSSQQSKDWVTIPPPYVQGGGPEFFPSSPGTWQSPSGTQWGLTPAVAGGPPVDCPPLDPNRDNNINGGDLKKLIDAYLEGPSHPDFCAVDANANGLADVEDIDLTVMAMVDWPADPVDVGQFVNVKAECNFKHHAVTQCDEAPPIGTRRFLVQAADKDGNPSNCTVKFRIYNCELVPIGPAKEVERGDRECATVDTNRRLEVWCEGGTEPCRISFKQLKDCPPPEE